VAQFRVQPLSFKVAQFYGGHGWEVGVGDKVGHGNTHEESPLGFCQRQLFSAQSAQVSNIPERSAVDLAADV
jgi:hypothetical protein